MILAIDFDGCLTRPLPPGTPPILRDGAADAVRALHAAGHSLILHSVRFGAEGSEALEREAELFLRKQGLWCLFERVWRETGKPYADLYLDDRSQKIGDLGVDGSVAWNMIGFWYGNAVADPTPAWAGAGEPPRLMVWRKVGDVVFWLVDGPRIRSTPEYNCAIVQHIGHGGHAQPFAAVDFTNGGNDARYPWIPPLEVWIDSAVSFEECGFIAVHEAVERYWMLEGKTYGEAHEIASRIEARLRAEPHDLDHAIETACGVHRMIGEEP